MDGRGQKLADYIAIFVVNVQHLGVYQFTVQKVPSDAVIPGLKKEL